MNVVLRKVFQIRREKSFRFGATSRVVHHETGHIYIKYEKSLNFPKQFCALKVGLLFDLCGREMAKIWEDMYIYTNDNNNP